ncbi:MAG: UvrD-helicase domain-containing protein, partial [Oscillospiraceae bacterium]
MPNWTKPQTDAITDRGGSLLISAAAGSGKTTVLVERAMRLICEGETPVTADSLLIMTFTNAAAAELRGRIATEIEKRIKKEPKNSWLQKQRLLIRRAQIGTVDSFCKQLVLENFNVLNVPSDVRVASDAEINDIKTEVLAQVVEEKNADPNFTAFAEVYGRSRSDAICDETILKLYGYLSSFPNREAQINVMENLYKNPLSLEVSLWGKQILAEAKVICARLIKYYNIAIRLVDMVAALEPYHDVLNSEFVFAKRIDELLLKNDFDGAVKLLQALSFGRLPTIKKSEIAEKDIATKDSVKQ